jgi:hypothetical protein
LTFLRRAEREGEGKRRGVGYFKFGRFLKIFFGRFKKKF